MAGAKNQRQRGKVPATGKGSRPDRALTDRIKQVVYLMVWEGLTDKQAAERVNITAEAVRQALLKPQVLAYQNEQWKALRQSKRPRALHRMVELSEQTVNLTAATAATRSVLSEDGDGRPGIGLTVNVSAPGYAIEFGRPREGRLASSDDDVILIGPAEGGGYDESDGHDWLPAPGR